MEFTPNVRVYHTVDIKWFQYKTTQIMCARDIVHLNVQYLAKPWGSSPNPYRGYKKGDFPYLCIESWYSFTLRINSRQGCFRYLQNSNNHYCIWSRSLYMDLDVSVNNYYPFLHATYILSFKITLIHLNQLTKFQSMKYKQWPLLSLCLILNITLCYQ